MQRIVISLLFFFTLCARALASDGTCHIAGNNTAKGSSMVLCATVSSTGNNGSILEEVNQMPDNEMQDDHLIHHNDFIYKIDTPANPSGDIVVLLHGSGGDETTLIPFARDIWPRATLIGIRGRLIQSGETRWYKKITPTRFDQKDIEHETDALVHFLSKLSEGRDLDISRITFVGYSNGANLLAVIMMKHPDLVRRVVLMRSMPVLDKMPRGDLRKTRVLTISGKNDTLYSPFAPALSSLLKMSGAKVDSKMVPGDHMLSDDDAGLIRQWIGNQDSDGISAMQESSIDKKARKSTVNNRDEIVD